MAASEDFTNAFGLAVPVLTGLLHREEDDATWAAIASVVDRLSIAVARRDASDLRSMTTAVQLILSDRARPRAGAGIGVHRRDNVGDRADRRTIPEPLSRIIEPIVASGTQSNGRDERPA